MLTQKIIMVIIMVTCFLYSKLFSQSGTFTHWTVNNGLSQSYVNCLFRDSEGYIWVGTQDGLNRFDGYTFQRFLHHPSDTQSIANNWIYCIDEDSCRNLWIGTRGGLSRYDKKKNLFQNFTPVPGDSNSLASDKIYGLEIDQKGNIFINTPPILNILNPKTGKIKRFRTHFKAEAGIYDQVIPIIADSQGKIWMGTPEGLALFNPATEKFSYFKNSRSAIPLHRNAISDLYVDRSQNVWIGTNDGLTIYSKSGAVIFSGHLSKFTKQNDDFIHAVVEDSKHNIWIGSNDGGLSKWKLQGNQLVYITKYDNSGVITAGSISHNNVQSLLIDQSENLWIGTLSGLDKTDLKEKKFRLYCRSDSRESVNLSDNVIASIYQDDHDILWIGTWGKGLNLFDRKTGKVILYSSKEKMKYYISNDYVHVIFKTSFGDIWIGTRNGIMVFDPNKKCFSPLGQFYAPKKLPDFSGNRIKTIFEDHNGIIWVGSNNGLFKINLKENRFEYFSAPDQISDFSIFSILEDNNHAIWVATLNGLDCYHPETNSFSHFYYNPGKANTLSDNFTVALCLDFEGKLWIGTKSGLNVFSTSDSTFLYFSEKDGLPGNLVYEIIEDHNHDMWLATGKGLGVYYRKTGKFKTYTVEDGLQSNEFNLRCAFKGKNGELFFGGMNGFNSFHPDSLDINSFPPAVAINSIEKTNKQGKRKILPDDDNRIVLNPDDHSLDLDFAALDFTNPSKNQYAYRLIGLSDDLIQLGPRKYVSFSKLSPGDYILEIHASNNDGVWSKSPAILNISVLPPWYKYKVAIITYVLLIILLIFLVIKGREKRLIQQKKVLELKVKQRTEEIEHQKEEITSQRDELEVQRDRIAIQNKNITSSIHYAKRIQTAVLPPAEKFDDLLPSHFILYRPKDIVSGDFYWLRSTQNHMMVAVADCTGHGVPGAFMSMLGVALLNEIVPRKDINHPCQVLNEMRNHVMQAMHQLDRGSEQKDGMDIAFCAIERNTFIMEYSGANSPVYVFRQNHNKEYEFYDLKPDRMPVGVYYKKDIPFVDKAVQLKKGDRVYMFTDGYIDQFGGNTGQKFLSGNFKKLLLSFQDIPFHEQKERLETALDQWKGNKFEQIDDILVIGFEV